MAYEFMRCIGSRRLVLIILTSIIGLSVVVAAIVVPILVLKNTSTFLSPATTTVTVITRTNCSVDDTKANTTSDSEAKQTTTLSVTTISVTSTTKPTVVTTTKPAITTTTEPSETIISNLTIASTTKTTEGTTISLVSHFELVLTVCNTRVGGPLQLFPAVNGNGMCLSPTPNERLAMLFDGNLTTKHVNFGIGDSYVFARNKGAGTGFVFRFPISKLVVLQAFQFGTGDGEPACDPITITIEGIAWTDFFSPVPDSSWKLVYNGSTGIDSNNDPGRNLYGKQQTIVEGSSYGAYRVLIASQRGIANTVQYSEVQLFGYFVT